MKSKFKHCYEVRVETENCYHEYLYKNFTDARRKQKQLERKGVKSEIWEVSKV